MVLDSLWRVHKGQRTTCSSQLFPTITWLVSSLLWGQIPLQMGHQSYSAWKLEAGIQSSSLSGEFSNEPPHLKPHLFSIYIILLGNVYNSSVKPNSGDHGCHELRHHQLIIKGRRGNYLRDEPFRASGGWTASCDTTSAATPGHIFSKNVIIAR